MTSNKRTWGLALSVAAIVLVNGALIYSWITYSNNPDDTGALFYPMLLLGLALLLVSAIAALVIHNSQTLCSPARERQAMLVIKLGLIPFFVLGGFLIFVMAVIPGGILASVIAAIIGWLIMMLGSVWAICYALSMKKAGMIGGGAAAAFIIMQFFFVLDVIAAIIMFFLGRSREKALGGMAP